jgi:hypothetical protein
VAHSIKYDNLGLGGIFSSYFNDLKATSKNFYDKAILANNIDVNAILSYHINDDGKNYIVNNILVENKHIINNSISNNKFAYESITYDKLHPDIKTFREKLDTFLLYQNNSINFDKVKDNSFHMNLIATQLAKFGKGILDKAVIPLNSIVITKPNQYAYETIDTYQLCIYAISNAYQLNTYNVPQPDNVYANPEYIKREPFINHLKNRLNGYYDQVNKMRNFMIVYVNNTKIDLLPYFEKFHLSRSYDPRQDILNLGVSYNAYQHAANAHVTYRNAFMGLDSTSNSLKEAEIKYPKNIYTPVPPVVYQKWEIVPNTKSYKKIEPQWVIRSYHLKDNSFATHNFLTREFNNIPSEKFINKESLDIDLQKKLGFA